MDELERGR
jgi:hypothetical protein